MATAASPSPLPQEPRAWARFKYARSRQCRDNSMIAPINIAANIGPNKNTIILIHPMLRADLTHGRDRTALTVRIQNVERLQIVRL